MSAERRMQNAECRTQNGCSARADNSLSRCGDRSPEGGAEGDLSAEFRVQNAESRVKEESDESEDVAGNCE